MTALAVAAAVGVGVGLVVRRTLPGSPIARRIDAAAPPSTTRSPASNAADNADNGVPRQVVLLTNPNAGSSRGLHRARSALITAGFEILDEVPVEHHPRLSKWLTREHPLLIVAAGGDGTVRTAADYLAHTTSVLGVLPLGTSNDFARSLGVPTDPVRAAHLLATGKISTLDIGRMVTPHGPARHFVHAASIGLNVNFAKLATQASLRRRFRRLTYLIAGAHALREHQPFDCELRHHDHVEHLHLVHLSVINAPVFGGFLGMRIHTVNLHDRVLDVVAVEHLSRGHLVRTALHYLLRNARPVPGVHTLQVDHLAVRTNPPLDIALDGEILATLPADFDVADQALRVVTPTNYNDINT
jgi:YegS/Rv2252/BmrU family lipid kinase